MAMALAMLPTLAQGSRQVITTADGKQYCLTSSQPDIKWEQRGDTWRPIHQTPQKAVSNEGTVNIKFEWDFADKKDVYPSTIRLLDCNGKNIEIWGEEPTQLLPGKYDLFAVASGNGYDGPFYGILMPDIEIIYDETIVINVSEASNLVQINDYHPNGQQFKGGENYSMVGINTGVNRKSDGCNLMLLVDYFFTGPIMPTIFMNDLGINYSFFQSRVYVTEDFMPGCEAYATFFTTEDITTPMENNPENYKMVTEDFYPSKISQQQADYIGFGVTQTVMFNEKPLLGHGVSVYTEPGINSTKLFINHPVINADTQGLFPLASHWIIDYGRLVEEELPWGMVQRPESVYMFTPNMILSSDEPLYMNLGLGNALDTWFYNDGISCTFPYFRDLYPFYYTSTQKKQAFGESVPILVYSYHPDLGAPGGNWLGRYGESRNTDNTTTELTISKNGEEIWCGMMNDYMMASAFQQEPPSVLESVYNNQNIIIDDLQGKNLTTIHYNEENNYYPTLTMLWFRANNGDATDRFNHATDGLLEFSACDVIPMTNSEWGLWMASQAVSNIEVSYSPYQANTWSELAVEEVPENFCSPGYGYFYRGSLAEVTGEALKGWFDLKVKLTDAAGNWQEQVISPAFRIDDLAYTSVATVGSDNAHEVARYSIDGKRVDATHRGVTIIRMSDGTTKKIVQ